MVIDTAPQLLTADKSASLTLGDKPLTVGIACAEALYREHNELRGSFEEKVMRAKLAERFINEGVVMLDTNEFDLLKRCLAISFSPLVCLQFLKHTREN